MKRKHHKGFSLIELIVTISLVSVISAGGMAAYNKFTERQRIVSAGKELENLFREAQKKAQSGDKPEQCGESTTLKSWSVSINASNSTAHLSVNCGVGESTNTHVVKTINLPSGIQTQPTNPTIPFTVLTGRPEGIGTNVTIQLGSDLQHNDAPRNTLTISSSGGIQNKGIMTREEDE